MQKIIISVDFSDAPGGRLRKEGPNSAEEFRDEILYPLFMKCLTDEDDSLEIDFDHCYGFSHGFLEEAFGGLVRNYKRTDVLEHLQLKCEDDPGIATLITDYVLRAIERL